MTPGARRSFLAFEQRAEAGDAQAQFRLSELLERGFDSIPPDTLRSLRLLRSSANAGYAPAMNYLGYLFQTGFPSDSFSNFYIIANPDSAQFWLHRAADAGDPKAAHNLAYLILDNPSGKDSDSIAVRYLTAAADEGLPQSMTLLADLCIRGRGLAPDTLRAVSLYERAVESRFPDAELRLLNTIGPRFQLLPDSVLLSEAIRYWKLGARTVSAEQLLQLVDRPAVPDPLRARAYALLGHAYSRGDGLAYDHRKANENFARAAILGDPSAQFILAETLEIFPDLLPDLLPDTPVNSITPAALREMAAAAGITTAEQATRALLDPL